MQHQTALDALTDLAVEVVTSGFALATEQHGTASDLGRKLREGATVQALLGPQLSKLATALSGDIERKTAVRYAAYLKHPRLGREPLIDEAENADISLNVAIVAAQASCNASTSVALALAILRVRAITQATGPACIYPPRGQANLGRTGQRQRRREITAADVPDAIAEVLLGSCNSTDEQAELTERLRAFEHSQYNEFGLVTKVLALVEKPDGQSVLHTISSRIRQARLDRGVDPDVVAPPRSELRNVRAVDGAVTSPRASSRATSVSEAVDFIPSSSAPSQDAAPLPSAAAAASVLARLEQRGPKGLSTKERLKLAHASRARPQQ